jgi:hypothetical protein
MRLSRLLSKHSADAANIQKSNSVNHFNSGKKSATDQKRWQVSKNDLYKFDS